MVIVVFISTLLFLPLVAGETPCFGCGTTASVEDAVEVTVEAASDTVPAEPCCDLSGCVDNSDGGYNCFDTSLPEELVEAFEEPFIMISCGEFPEQGLTPDCKCYVGDGTMGSDYDPRDLCISCDIIPGTGDEYKIAYDCSNKLSGSCVGLDPSGTCIPTPCCGLSQCSRNDVDGYNCFDEPLPKLPADSHEPSENTFLMFSCDSIPRVGLTDDCECYVGTGEFGPDYNSSDLCTSCEIIRVDGEDYELAYNCSNKFTGSCVGFDEKGNCISNLEVESASDVAPPGFNSGLTCVQCVDALEGAEVANDDDLEVECKTPCEEFVGVKSPIYGACGSMCEVVVESKKLKPDVETMELMWDVCVGEGFCD